MTSANRRANASPSEADVFEAVKRLVERLEGDGLDSTEEDIPPVTMDEAERILAEHRAPQQ
jgi:Asp-tRNA(Asn)/Glu-tRNA(Gln) amidotransferase A subunit family amidase